MTQDLDSIRERWISERPIYQTLADHIRDLLRGDLQRQGILCSVEGRAKDVASLLKKVMRKSYASPYEEIHDKAGVRVIVAFSGEVAIVENAVQRRFQVDRYENKTLGLEYSELGYLGVHFDVALRESDVIRPEWRSLIAEIQVHTKAQNCWSDVSHRLLYKQDHDTPTEIKRRVYRLMALIELFDETVQESRKAIEMLPGAPEAAVLRELEQYFYQFAGRAYDRDLSLRILEVLEGLYDHQEKQAFHDVISAFVEKNRPKLAELFAAYRNDERGNPLIFQPESLIVFERLEHDPFRLRDSWAATLPMPLLESLAAIWGRPI